MNYTLNPRPEKSIRVFGRGLRISAKSSAKVCKAITGLSLPKAQVLTSQLVEKKKSIGGKHYTNIATELHSLLKSAEANTEFKGMIPDRMFVHASAHESFTFQTPRRFKQRGRKRKISNIQLVLQQR